MTDQEPSPISRLRYQIRALTLTFLLYAAFHSSRKPLSITKSTLSTTYPPHLLGLLDVAFLSSYSLSMLFLSGPTADRLPLRPLILFSSVASSLSAIFFSLPSFFPFLHSLVFLASIQVISGLVQSFAWPVVVAVVENWFHGSEKKGLVMGVWNSHTSFGNVVGSVMAAGVLEYGWGWSFVLPGAVLLIVGIFVYLFIVVSPKEVGFENEVVAVIEMVNGEEREDVGFLHNGVVRLEEEKAIGFLDAWKLPGVAPFAFSLFFSKLVAYTFLYWLPFYIQQTNVAGKQLSHKTSGNLSTIFDLGGILGGVSAGFISDKLNARAITSAAFLFLSIPSLVSYHLFGHTSIVLTVTLMFLSGYFVNGPYSLITTAVAADLGTQSAVKGNSRALATVTAIIDGTGSVGAALGPLLTGYLSTVSWTAVFFMLVFANFLAILCLVRIAKDEVDANSWFQENCT